MYAYHLWRNVSFLVYRCIINSILFQWKIDDFPPYSLIFSVGLSNVSTWWELKFWKKNHKLDLLFLKCVIVYSRFFVTQNHVFPQEAVCWLKNHTSRKKKWNRVTFIAVNYYLVTKHPNSLGAKICMFFLHLFLKVQIVKFFLPWPTICFDCPTSIFKIWSMMN